MDDFVEANFAYISQFIGFGWMAYLNTKYPIYENVLLVFFSNAELEKVDEDNKNLCKAMAINTYVMGV